MFFSKSIKTKQDLIDNFENFIYVQEAMKFAYDSLYTNNVEFTSTWERYRETQLHNIYKQSTMKELIVTQSMMENKLKSKGESLFPYKKVMYQLFYLNDFGKVNKCKLDFKNKYNFDEICLKYTRQLPNKVFKNLDISHITNMLDSTLFYEKVGSIVGPIKDNNSNVFISINASVNDSTKLINLLKENEYKKLEIDLLKKLKTIYKVYLNKDFLASFSS